MHLNELEAKLDFPKDFWSLKEDGAEILRHDFTKNRKYFRFTPTNKVNGGYYDNTHKSGSGFDQHSGKKLPLNHSKSILCLNLESKEFELVTNLQDPRIVSIIESTVKHFPEFSNFNVVKFLYDSNADEYRVQKFGTVQSLLKSKKSIKGTAPAYGEDKYEQFELEVFKELSDDNWFHATKASSFKEILKSKYLLPSGEQDQGSGWTQFNLNLQHAVYLTKNKQYAVDIAYTLMDRFEEDAVIIEISGKALKTENYGNIAVDEDALRNDFDGAIVSFAKSPDDDFIKYNDRLPEFLEGITNKIESIGFKGRISADFFIDVDSISYADNKNE